MTARRTVSRAGFTMIELLVVILIIGILAALLTAGVGKVREQAKKATAAAEIAQIGNAVAAFKSKMNANFIPAFRPGTTPTAAAGQTRFRLCSCYAADATGAALDWPEVAYLRSVFPQMNLLDNGLRLKNAAGQLQFIQNGSFNAPVPAGSTPLTGPLQLDPGQSLTFFLTGGAFTNYQGFSTNRSAPFTRPTGSDNRVGPFIDTKSSKVDSKTDAAGDHIDVPGHYLDPWDTPYAYFAFDPGLNRYPVNTADPQRLGWPLVGDKHTTDAAADMAPNGLLAFQSGTVFQNQKTFQVISAGPDQLFGRGGAWTAGAGDYVSTGVGADDISNFNNGPLNQQSQ